MNWPLLESGMASDSHDKAKTGGTGINTIVSGSDHAGFPLKKRLIQALTPAYSLMDVGTEAMK